MRPTISAIVFFLIMVSSMVTPAAAQFGQNAQVYVFTPDVAPDGQVTLRVFTTQCTQNYQLFFRLLKAEGQVWVNVPQGNMEQHIVPIGLNPMAPGVEVQKGVAKLPPGTYRLENTQYSEYGNRNRNIDESRYCQSGLRDYVLRESITFTVGGQSASTDDTPLVLPGDQYTALKERVVRFGALLPNAARLTFFQRGVDGTVRYFVTDEPATPGDFQRISVGLPKNFSGELPVEVNVVDKTTNVSLGLTVLQPNPVVPTLLGTTNR